MECASNCCLRSLAVLLMVTIIQCSQVHLGNENGTKTVVFMSPKFVLEPGSVAEKSFYNIDFPKGHIAIKSFDAEVVDEAGNPVPLHETYVHHWIATRYYQRKVAENLNNHHNAGSNESDLIVIKNNGLCHRYLPQYFGLGSETRKTETHVPDPYGIEIGNPAEIPDGFEEGWMLDVHAIDTRGAEDSLGCIECRCDLYNVTKDRRGQALRSDYVGGLDCCYEKTKCRVKEGFQGPKRSLYLKYTVKYVDWENSILPVKIYILDVTDTWKGSNESRGLGRHDCQIEYDVDSCSAAVDKQDCIHTKRVSISLPSGGDVIYAVAHQHTGGIGSTLYGEDGRVLCSSIPIYGEGTEPGNESGYIVGMSTCYPKPGSVKMSSGELLTLVSNYSSAQRRIGVMGLFYILVADPLPEIISAPHAAVEIHEKLRLSKYAWVVMVLGAAAVVGLAIAIAYRRRSRKSGYVSIVT